MAVAHHRGRRQDGGAAGDLAAAALLAAAAITSTIAPHHKPDPGPAQRAEPNTSKTGLLGRLDLAQQRNRYVSFAVGVIRKFSDDRAGRLAALIAYYGFFSVFPAMLALVTVLGFVLEDDPGLRADIADSALAQFPIVGDSIAESVSSPLTGNPVALVIGLVGAVWAGMGMVQACQDAMNEVWTVERAHYPGFVGKRVRSLTMLLLFGTLLVVSTSVAQLIHVVASGVVTAVLLFIASIALNVLLFMVAYRVLTVADVTWRMVLPGAVFSGTVFTLAQYLGGLYVSRTLDGATETYGTFAVVIGLLSWIFLLAQVMVLGAEVNTVAARRLWPRSLFTDPATKGDRRSHASQATSQRMDREMQVDVTFEDPQPAPATKE